MHKVNLSAPLALLAASKLAQVNVPFDMHFEGDNQIELRCKNQETLMSVVLAARNMAGRQRSTARQTGVLGALACDIKVDMDQH